jgi:alpha-tubulin suppressor-like RCC1 family protein
VGAGLGSIYYRLKSHDLVPNFANQRNFQMPVYQCGFVANAPGEPGCSKDISSATLVSATSTIQLAKVFQGGWGFATAADKDGELYIWGVNAATMLGKGGMFSINH